MQFLIQIHKIIVPIQTHMFLKKNRILRGVVSNDVTLWTFY